AHRTSLANSPFVWDDALNAWTHQLGKELTPSSPSPAVRAVAESMLFEEARLGTVIVNVKVRVGVETKTIPVKVTVVDMERPMLPGWNLASTPVALGINTMGNIANLGDKLDYDLAVRWDPVTQVWKNVFASQVVSPLDAMYVRARSFTQMGLVFSRNNTTPPTEQVLARGSGWNLMGPSLVKGRNGTGDDSYFEMPLVSALKSIEGKYDAVVSPGESWAFTQEYRTAGGAVVDTHDWSFNQDAWVYLAGDAAVPQMTVGGGYWVHSTSDGSLAGLTQTPLSFAGWNPFD
ncbi:MAG: hypothetical protein HYX90_06140, partial [Chloroflexi bacterium]|nr:hypothetical protein [Chloroflexota bacterium]